MKLQFAFLLLALSAVLVFGQESLMTHELQSYGTGVVLVPIDRVALTITVTGTDTTAAGAVASANTLEGQVNETLRNFTIYDIRSGGLILEPLYQGSSLSFAAHMSLSVVINAADLPVIIDQLVILGVSNISFVFTPDFYAVELAQSQSLQLAVTDALFKAQAVLSMLHLCASNITRIEILNPTLELPSLTFSLFANMGNMRNININMNNNNPNNNNNNNNNRNNNKSNNNGNMNNLLNSPPMMFGAAAPIIEGSNQEVVSYVRIWIYQLPCSLAGSGAIQDITSSLDLSNIVGISGGKLPTVSSSGSFMSASGSGSPISSGMNRRSVRSTMW
jgi:uncharacterized protein YggE